MTLTPAQARRFYDRFGSRQDAQGYYEDRALDDLVEHAHFARAERVFEFGCGTGRFAARLLAEHLPASATYVGCDASAAMVRLASDRLRPYGARARVLPSDGRMRIPSPDRSVDRFVSTYVIDLLSPDDARALLAEAHRVLAEEGRLCLVSLTCGTTFLSRLVSAAWTAAFRLRPLSVGGCRPVRLERWVDPRRWTVEYRNVVIACGVPSEVLIARRSIARR